MLSVVIGTLPNHDSDLSLQFNSYGHFPQKSTGFSFTSVSVVVVLLCHNETIILTFSLLSLQCHLQRHSRRFLFTDVNMKDNVFSSGNISLRDKKSISPKPVSYYPEI